MPKKTRELSAKKLAKLVEAGMKEVPLLTGIELEIEDRMRQFAQEQMDKKLADLPSENDRPKACIYCGANARIRARNVKRTFKSLNGTHTIYRHQHYCEKCKKSFYPKDELLGLPREGDLSNELEARVADFALNDPYETAETRWNFHFRHMKFSSNQFRQVSSRLGAMVEETESTVLHASIKPPDPVRSETLYVMADGSMLPMRDGNWSEAKVGTFFRKEHHLKSGDGKKRGCISQSRYVAVLGGIEEFREEMRVALRVENGVRAELVVFIGDGAPWVWNMASMIAPSALQILDWGHAIEAGMRCAKAIFGEYDPLLPVWKERIESLLWHGRHDLLFEELRLCLEGATSDQTESLQTLLGYYDNNRERMKYDEFRSRGVLIGSGPVESAHRHVLQTRMKKAGQHWGQKGGRQMARMRAIYRTTGPERFYRAIHWANRQSHKLSAAALRKA